MGFFRSCTALCFISFFIAQAAFGQSSASFGTYVGTFQHAKIDKDQYAKLDFIFSREAGNNFELMAVLSLYFGDFGSKEYISYHFHDVKYNLLTGTLVFDQSDQDLTIITSSFGSGSLQATVRSSAAGDVGTLVLQKDGSANPTRDHVLSLAGKYNGSCDGNDSILQLSTYKTTDDTVRVGNPFGSYNVNGQLGDWETFSCPNARRKPCTTDLINSGSYDYFQGQLTLFGRRRTYECDVDGNTISCDQCTFTKVAGDSDSGSVKKPLTSVSQISSPTVGTDPALGGTVSSIAGEYKGFLHHERLDQYQYGSINIVTYQQSGGGSQELKMSASAKLYFGDFASRETLPYRFTERTYNILTPVFVFERTGDDVDAILQITSIRDGVVQGVWHSLLFGRVGTFEFRKDRLPTLPGDAKLFKKIAGNYESNTFEVQVGTRLGSTPVNTENPFFPQIFSGYFYYKSGIAPRIDITGGSYDFYTGKLAFEIRDGERIAVGLNNSDDRIIKVMWPSRVISTILQDYEQLEELRP